MLAEAREKFHCLSIEEWAKITSILTYSETKVFYYLLSQNPMGDRTIDCRVRTIASVMGISVGSVSSALDQLKVKKLLPSWVVIPRSGDTESRIRDCLHEQLGGLKEVTTPAGRIDLLTDSEIIEVKHVSDWKSAMGQVLAYSGFYPEHKKRIHLFGKKRELPSSTAVTICSELGITLTFEEVE